ncbi:MAG TPA: sensor histidine kinase [Chryseosolibacter sp.]|nr:sensor histidine kinase [Chryseosolibacter sp.]
MKKPLFIVLLFVCHHLPAQQAVVDSLKQVVASHSGDTLSINALNVLAVEYARTDLKRALECLYEVIAISQKFNTTNGLSNTYSQMVTTYQNTGYADSAKKYLQKLEMLAANATQVKVKINYYSTAGLFYKNTGNFREALPYMLKSLELLNDDKYNVTRAGQLLNIGNTYSNLGEMEEAARYHIDALRLFEKLNNKRGQSFCLQSLGNDFLKLDQFATARTYFEQSLKMKEELKDNRGLVTAWAALGQVNRELNNYGEARIYLEKALTQVAALKLNSEHANVLLQLGLLEKKMGNVPRARSFMAQAHHYAQTTSDELTMVKIETELKALDRETGQAELQQALVKKVLASSVSGDKQSEAEAHANLAEHYASRKRYDEAYRHLTKFIEIRDSVQGSRVVLQLRELEKKYQTERKENEIALLKKDQSLKAAIIAKQNSNLVLTVIALVSVMLTGGLLINRYRVINRVKRQVEIEKVRNNIARDLHDDIGSTLSSINIMSQLALQNVEQGPQHLKRIAENSSRMMENMTDIVWSINPGNDSVEMLVARMKEFAAEILEPRNISYLIGGEETLSGLKVEIEDRKNLFLIFKEAINNAAKYSDASDIRVRFDRTKNIIRLVIEDNGQGFDPSSARQGNGLRNMKSRAEALGGRLSLRTAPGKGVVITLEAPIT